MRKPKFETCIHAKEVGPLAVYVYPSCPNKILLRGMLVCTKFCCRNCSRWEAFVKKRYGNVTLEVNITEQMRQDAMYCRQQAGKLGNGAECENCSLNVKELGICLAAQIIEVEEAVGGQNE